MSEPEDRVMTVQEVSAYLRLAESTIYKLAQEGQIPGRKIGGRWRFSRPGLDRWLEHGLEHENDNVSGLEAKISGGVN